MGRAISIMVGIFFCLAISSAYASDFKGKRVLWLNSYHQGYVWSDEIGRSIQAVIQGTGIEFKAVHLDTKRNRPEQFKLAAALHAKKIIEEFQPDIVIASDDNACKYVIVPYFRDTDLPVVFCGVNWDAAGYGFPAANVTGMVEVVLVEQMVEELLKHARGKRIGLLVLDSVSGRKEAEFFRSKVGGDLTISYVKTFDQWKNEFARLQDEVDCLRITLNICGASDWDVEEAKEFIMEHTKVPTGAGTVPMSPYALVTFTKVASEQGEWAAQTALRILSGTPPAQIPLTSNKNSKIYLNMALAKKMGVKFSMDLIERSHFVGEEVTDLP